MRKASTDLLFSEWKRPEMNRQPEKDHPDLF